MRYLDAFHASNQTPKNEPQHLQCCGTKFHKGIKILHEVFPYSNINLLVSSLPSEVTETK